MDGVSHGKDHRDGIEPGRVALGRVQRAAGEERDDVQDAEQGTWRQRIGDPRHEREDEENEPEREEEDACLGQEDRPDPTDEGKPRDRDRSDQHDRSDDHGERGRGKREAQDEIQGRERGDEIALMDPFRAVIHEDDAPGEHRDEKEGERDHAGDQVLHEILVPVDVHALDLDSREGRRGGGPAQPRHARQERSTQLALDHRGRGVVGVVHHDPEEGGLSS